MPFDTLPPPSYEISTSKQWLVPVAPYLRGHDLALAIRVCQSWSQVLLPYLWGDPAAHFPPNAEEAQLAFLGFRQVLPRSRLGTRSLTHTLKLPQAFTGVDYQPNASWLRQILQGLPNLQSLVLPSTPFLDHEALVLLRQGEAIRSLQNLRLLALTHAANVTTAGLLDLLNVPTRLLYVDLSGTRAARHAQVLARLSAFPELRVLKVAGIALGDELATIMFDAVQTRVQHLDIAHNDLTDRSVGEIGRMCLKDSFDPTRPPDGRRAAGQQPWLSDVKRIDTNAFNLLTSSFADSLMIESTPDEGIQSLNISHNNLSYLAVLSLVNCGRLQALDAGNCSVRQTQSSAPLLEPSQSRLKYLRIPHHLVTGVASSRKPQADQAQLQRFLHTTLDTLEQVEAERQNRILEFHGDGVVPALHPQLQALVLTSIPARSAGRQLSQAFIELLRDCSMEWRLASLQTRLDYRLPPGQRGTVARLHEQAKQLFALDEITLELASSNESHTSRPSGWMHSSGQMSMTGDVDSEALWNAYASDFSFFGNERALDTDKENPSQGQLSFDTVAEIATFRKKVKGEYELAISHGEAMPRTDGYWEGKIKVVRP